jgi:hypothetical protein
VVGTSETASAGQLYFQIICIVNTVSDMSGSFMSKIKYLTGLD